jgi:formylglycine-generating enzyme required for sulfatase activity
MEFVLVPKGKFPRGGGRGKVGMREIEIAHDFYLGKYEVTQEEWQKVMGTNPSWFSRKRGGKEAVKGISDGELKRFPVDDVSWDVARSFVQALNAQEKEPGWVYRLPTEAEWEYACRGGPTANRLDYGSDFYFDRPSTSLRPDQANYQDSGLQRTCRVGSYPPNRLGLYDMHGNVWEWCDDHETAANGESHRLTRGGSWCDPSQKCRAASRLTLLPEYHVNHRGLRLARVPVGTEGK